MDDKFNLYFHLCVISNLSSFNWFYINEKSLNEQKLHTEVWQFSPFLHPIKFKIDIVPLENSK